MITWIGDEKYKDEMHARRGESIVGKVQYMKRMEEVDYVNLVDEVDNKSEVSRKLDWLG